MKTLTTVVGRAWNGLGDGSDNDLVSSVVTVSIQMEELRLRLAHGGMLDLARVDDLVDDLSSLLVENIFVLGGNGVSPLAGSRVDFESEHGSAFL